MFADLPMFAYSVSLKETEAEEDTLSTIVDAHCPSIEIPTDS